VVEWFVCAFPSRGIRSAEVLKERKGWPYLIGVVEGVIHEAGDKRGLADYFKIKRGEGAIPLARMRMRACVREY
jgi:hypothetical protein